MDEQTQYFDMRRVTLVGALVNLILAIFKIVIGYGGASQALLADGIHSLSDLLSDVLVLFGVKYGRRAADADHPYGHGRIETAATFALAVFIACAGMGIIYHAIHDLVFTQSYVQPSKLVLMVAVLSVLSNEGIYRYTLKVAKQTQSTLLTANAWHNRSDAWSSLIVLFALLGSYLGWHSLDHYAAVVVGLFIIYMGWHISWHSLRELVDTGLDAAAVTHLRRSIAMVDGVSSLHQLRTRSMGSTVLLDVHVLVDSHISVSEGHYIGEQVALHVRAAHQDIKDITVHVDPEDDECVAPSRNLVNRASLESLLRKHLVGLIGADSIKNIVLHYLAGKIEVELWLDKEILLHLEGLLMEEVQQQYQQALQAVDDVRSVRLLFC